MKDLWDVLYPIRRTMVLMPIEVHQLAQPVIYNLYLIKIYLVRFRNLNSCS